ncbi:MAG: GTPase Era, partial [Deltaproteobacteria bacterium]
EEVVRLLPHGPLYYPEDMVTDQTERVLAAEVIREKIFHLTRQEVPYSCAVLIEEFREEREKSLLYIRAVINVERESQKGILIGKGGRMLKEIGTASRRELEGMFGKKVYLELWVRVQDHWRKKDPILRDFGLIR